MLELILWYFYAKHTKGGFFFNYYFVFLWVSLLLEQIFFYCYCSVLKFLLFIIKYLYASSSSKDLFSLIPVSVEYSILTEFQQVEFSAI